MEDCSEVGFVDAEVESGGRRIISLLAPASIRSSNREGILARHVCQTD